MAHYGGKFVRRVADSLIVAEGDASVPAAVFKPLLVRSIWREKVVVPLDRKAGGREDIGKAFAQVAVGEIDADQAARS